MKTWIVGGSIAPHIQFGSLRRRPTGQFLSSSESLLFLPFAVADSGNK